MKPVFLIGYMGCGKTTLGEALAREMDLTYIDLDQLIEHENSMTITQIFKELGEDRFREIETATLAELTAMTDVIVGCGGGTPCHGQNMELMNQAGTTVWLTTSPERITARLLLPEEKCKRPKVSILPDEAILPFVERELEERTPCYSQAKLQFYSTDIETAAATRRTAKRLAAFLESRSLSSKHENA